MPPVVIQPGLGDSLNRYLDRLNRRGEQQRALQAQRDNLQARMDARRDETRTRMISRSIDNAAGLYTGEIIKDRASERRLGEAEDLQRLEGRPSRLQARSELGIPVMHNSKYDLIMSETRLDDLHSEIRPNLFAACVIPVTEDVRSAGRRSVYRQANDVRTQLPMKYDTVTTRMVISRCSVMTGNALTC